MYLFCWRMRKTKGCGFSCGLSLRWDPYKANSSRTTALSSPHESCRRFSLGVIRKATNNFDHDFIFRSGTFGNTYKGSINGGNTVVSIKRYTYGSHERAHEFKTEIDLLSHLHHPNLVSLIGYCNEKHEMIVVYNYMINGSLWDHLHEPANDRLLWKQRLEICIGAAKGLHFLHTGGKQTIIHRDVKSLNILLDEKWVPKLSDFGMSLMGPSGMPNTLVNEDEDEIAGTWGYLDPEYSRHQILTEKSDVYSFGVVLLEVLCGRKALDRELDDEDRWLLAEWAQKCSQNGTIDQIIDPNLMGKIAPVCLKEFVAIAKSCLRDNGIERPMMGDVVEGLEFALQLQESADAANEEIDSGDDEPHNEYIYHGMSFGASFGEFIITTARTDVVSSQGGRVSTWSGLSSPGTDSDSVKSEEVEEVS